MSCNPLKDLIRQVNGRVNRRFAEDSDPAFYDAPDFWTAGLANEATDHALVKARMLLDQGFPEDQLAVAMCIDETGAYHATLLAVVEDGTWCLDNRHFYIKRAYETGYLFEKVQLPGTNEWVHTS